MLLIFSRFLFNENYIQLYRMSYNITIWYAHSMSTKYVALTSIYACKWNKCFNFIVNFFSKPIHHLWRHFFKKNLRSTALGFLMNRVRRFSLPLLKVSCATEKLTINRHIFHRISDPFYNYNYSYQVIRHAFMVL